MQIPIIQGQFNAKDAADIISKFIEIKIKYHEGKIKTDSSEEDIKYRETKIKTLQNYMKETRQFLLLKENNIVMEAIINIS